jgi:hypothetical protein
MIAVRTRICQSSACMAMHEVLALDEGVRHILQKLMMAYKKCPTSAFYLQYVLVHSANCVKTCIQWHVEECSLAPL